MRQLLFVLAASAMASGAHAAITFDFSSPTGNLGTTETYTASGLSVTASGFNASNSPTDLFGKNAGAGEQGLGLTNDPTGDGEIHFQSGYVQLDVQDLFNKVVAGSTFFSMSSTTDGEQWGVFGSNVAGSFGGAPLLSGTDEGQHLLPNFGQYRYYDFVELNTTPGEGDNVLLHSLSTTAVPEPATWAMMIMGFGGLGAMMRRRRAVIALTA
jgi:PEP-CTERM motif